jgi:hypothetical protein
VDPILLACDVSVAALLVLLLVRCVPPTVVIPLVQGCVLGTAAGAVAFGLDGILREPWFSVIGALILFVGVPIAIYALSLGHKRQKTAIIVLACVALPACIRAGLVVEGLRDGSIDEMIFDPKHILILAASSGVLAGLCFLVMLLHKKVLPAIWRKKRDALPAAAVHGDEPQIVHSSGQTDGRVRIRRAALYTSLLAIVVYIGWHFWTIRTMREDDFAVSDAIDAEFERLKVPLEGYSMTFPQGDSELLKAGWNVFFQVEVLVDHKTTYEAEIKKSILVPWIQVKMHKKE